MDNQQVKPEIVETPLESLNIAHYKDEPFFVLLGRDPAAPDVIQLWCKAREKAEPGTQKVMDADKIALDMRVYKSMNPHLGLDLTLYQNGISKMPIRKTAIEKTHKAFILAVDDAYFRHTVETRQVGFTFKYAKPVNVLPMARFFDEAQSYLSIREREYLDNSTLVGSRDKGDTAYRQLLPYLIPRQVQPDGTVIYFPYRRTKKVGEQRLAGNGSIGYGGHPELEDVVFTKSVIDLESTLQLGMLREADEEFKIVDQSGDEISVEATNIVFSNQFILDDSEGVHLLHVGIVMFLDVPVGCSLVVKEDELSNLPPMTAEQMLTDPEFSAENWTRHYLEAAHADIADRLTLNHGDEEMVDMHDLGFSEPMTKEQAEATRARMDQAAKDAEADAIDLATEEGQAKALEALEGGAASLTPDQEAEVAFGPGNRSMTAEEFAIFSEHHPSLTSDELDAIARELKLATKQGEVISYAEAKQRAFDKLKAVTAGAEAFIDPEHRDQVPPEEVAKQVIANADAPAVPVVMDPPMLNKCDPETLASLTPEQAVGINSYEFEGMTEEQLRSIKKTFLESLELDALQAYVDRCAATGVVPLLAAAPAEPENLDFATAVVNNSDMLKDKINAISSDIRTTATGLKIWDQVVGKGDEAQNGLEVMVHYTGYLVNGDESMGTKFDSSRDRGQPFRFDVGAHRVIKGWDEGVVGMRVGGKRRLLIPAELGYGEPGIHGTIPPNAKLMFDIELLAV